VTKLAIFASGTGSNATCIVDYFKDHPEIQVALILSNKAAAPVLEMAQQKEIPTHVFSRTDFYESESVLDQLHTYEIDAVILAGFLWLVPGYLVKAFPNRILNIHPALLPAFGGKGMYGRRVHQAVKESGVSATGMTIHLVNEEYDEGAVLFQATCPVYKEDTAEGIARRVLSLEHAHFAPVIEGFLKREN